MSDVQAEVNADATVLGYDAEAIVKKYIEIRDFMADEVKAFKARMKPYEEAMVLLEGAAAMLMKKTKQRALSTDYGTAFPSPHVKYTVNDPALWHAWVREKQLWSVYTNHISKEALEEYLELVKDPETGIAELPPGIADESYIKTHFRSR